MLRKELPRIVIALLIFSTGCDGQDPAAADANEATVAKSKKVLVIGIDGLRPDALQKATTPNLDRLMAEGAFTLEARTQMSGPTSSGPGWMSILTGVEPAKHGVMANGAYEDRNDDYPTFVWTARNDLGLRTVAAFNWGEFLLNIFETYSYDDYFYEGDQELTDRMTGILSTDTYDVHFVHLDEVDGAGHGYGFSPDVPEYIAQTEDVDQQVGAMITALESRTTYAEEDWLVLVTTDHGGEGTSHGALTPECRTIFFIAWGSAVESGDLTGDDISHVDIQPTVLTFLGVESSELQYGDGKARALK